MSAFFPCLYSKIQLLKTGIRTSKKKCIYENSRKTTTTTNQTHDYTNVMYMKTETRRYETKLDNIMYVDENKGKRI